MVQERRRSAAHDPSLHDLLVTVSRASVPPLHPMPSHPAPYVPPAPVPDEPEHHAAGPLPSLALVEPPSPAAPAASGVDGTRRAILLERRRAGAHVDATGIAAPRRLRGVARRTVDVALRHALLPTLLTAVGPWLAPADAGRLALMLAVALLGAALGDAVATAPMLRLTASQWNDNRARYARRLLAVIAAGCVTIAAAVAVGAALVGDADVMRALIAGVVLAGAMAGATLVHRTLHRNRRPDDALFTVASIALVAIAGMTALTFEGALGAGPVAVVLTAAYTTGAVLGALRLGSGRGAELLAPRAMCVAHARLARRHLAAMVAPWAWQPVALLAVASLRGVHAIGVLLVVVAATPALYAAVQQAVTRSRRARGASDAIPSTRG